VKDAPVPSLLTGNLDFVWPQRRDGGNGGVSEWTILKAMHGLKYINNFNAHGETDMHAPLNSDMAYHLQQQQQQQQQENETPSPKQPKSHSDASPSALPDVRAPFEQAMEFTAVSNTTFLHCSVL
jgi:hypothetical protein